MMRRMNHPESTWVLRAKPAPHSLVLFVGLGSRSGVAPGDGLADGLARAGVRALWLERIDQALAAAEHARFDAVVVRLDASVSVVGRQLDSWRRTLACPLLLLADLEDEVDEIMALELGADGVLAQPVSSRRLRAHLLMLLRRNPQGEREPRPEATAAAVPAAAGGWALDRVHNRLTRDGRQVNLTEMQAALMQVLLDDIGRVVPRSRLLGAASLRRALQPRSVDVYVARLRQRLHDERADDLLLEGVRGRGYRLSWTPPVSPAWPTARSTRLDWAAPPLSQEALPMPMPMPSSMPTPQPG
jgi:DNA-binding response OmpR family regulator